MTAQHLSTWLPILACLSPAALAAAEPSITNLNLRGLRIDATTTLIVDGTDLGANPRLLLPFPAKQTFKPGAVATRAIFDVAVPPEVLPGYYQLRVVAEGGVSLPVLVGVDRLPQLPIAPAIEALPTALHGAVAGSGSVEVQFTGKAGQKVMAEVEAQRLGSRLRPVLHLSNAKRLQLSWSWPTLALGGDTRLEAVLPADGTYTLHVHDLEYAAQAPSYFRLKVGQWAFVDQVFPRVVGQGQKQAVELIGAAPAPPLDVSAPATPGAMPLPWPRDGLWSGPRPFVLVSPTAEVVRQGSDLQPLPEAPVAASGRLTRPFSEDLYRLPVKPASRLRLEVWAERTGSPVDTALVIRNEKGDQLARGEDSPGTLDPVVDYTVPAGVTALVLAVVDAQGRGGPRAAYRLNVEPQQPAGSSGDFLLSTISQRVCVAVNGSRVVPVLADRRGYKGAIELAAANLPAGMRLEGTTIPAESDGALVTVLRDATAGPAAITAWTGRGNGIQREVVVKDHPLARLQPWLATEIALAPVATPADLQIDWRELKPDAALVPAGKLLLPVQLTRPASPSVVRLTLLASQPAFLVNNQPDPNRSLRMERPVELAANAGTGEISVLVPPDLPGAFYDLTVVAELLSADKRTAIATAFAPVRRLPVRQPLLISLAGPARLPVPLDPKTGATVKIQGKIERLEGLAGDVSVTLLGFPSGAVAAVLKPTETDFTLNVSLPANQPPGEITGKLEASGVVDPKVPNVRVRARDVEMTLVVEAAGK